MPNEQNLIPVNKRSKEEARKISIKGGIARGKQRTKQKTYKEILGILNKEKLLDQGSSGLIKKKIKEMFPNIPEEELTYKLAPTFSLLAEAIKGDVKAFEVLRDTIGEKMPEKQEIKALINIKLNKDIKKDIK